MNTLYECIEAASKQGHSLPAADQTPVAETDDIRTPEPVSVSRFENDKWYIRAVQNYKADGALEKGLVDELIELAPAAIAGGISALLSGATTAVSQTISGVLVPAVL